MSTLTESPVFAAVAQMAGIEPGRLARAAAQPEHSAEHISLAELERLRGALPEIIQIFM